MNTFQEIKYPHLGITIQAALNRDESEIQENIRINCKRGLPQVWPHAEQETVIAICAGGPSLAETIDELRDCQDRGGKIVALAGVAKYLIDRGIKPNAHVLLDSRIGNVNFVTDADCTYFVASQCDPKVFDALEGRKVYIWHAFNGPKEVEGITESYDKWVPVHGGNTISLRSLRLFQILGYHKFELFGVDSCNIDGKHHAYEQPAADDQEEAVIALNGRPFKVTAWQLQQAMEFMKIVKAFGSEWEIRSHGNGLISHMINEGG